jgi:DNA helicase HerA-like ATPase
VLDYSQTPLILGQTGRFSFQTYQLPQEERRAHMYVIGTTTKGKSKLLEHCLFQDITRRRGAGVVDPHGDLTDDIIRYLVGHKDRSFMKRYYFEEMTNANKFVYVDPTRKDYIIPFNPLSLSGSTPAYDLALELVEIFRRVWSDSLREAPQFSNIFLNSLLVLIANNLTLLELQKLLTDKEYREYLLQQVATKAIADFFHERYDRWGKDSPLMIESTLNKVNAFTLNEQLRLILGQQTTLNVRQIMDEGLVLAVNLGSCAEETARLLGSLLTAKIQQTALSRRDISLRENRRPFYLYLDEFQIFVAQEGGVKTFSRILSEAAKFGLHLILAHQTQSQMSELMKGSLGNIGVKVVFGVERDDAEYIAKSVFLPNVDEVREEAKTETQHDVYNPLVNQWEQFTQLIDKKSLPSRIAYVVSHSRPAVKIKTIKVHDRNCTDEHLELVKKYSVMRWGRPISAVRSEIDLRIDVPIQREYEQAFY